MYFVHIGPLFSKPQNILEKEAILDLFILLFREPYDNSLTLLELRTKFLNYQFDNANKEFKNKEIKESLENVVVNPQIYQQFIKPILDHDWGLNPFSADCLRKPWRNAPQNALIRQEFSTWPSILPCPNALGAAMNI